MKCREGIMEPTEIDAFCKKILKNNACDYIDKQLDEVSRNDLYDLANTFLESPFQFNYALISTLNRLFDDTPEFVRTLSKFFEVCPDFVCGTHYKCLIEEKAVEKPYQAFSIVKSMLHLGDTPGVSSGIILSLLVEEMGEARDFMISGMYSEDIPSQRCSLVVLHALLCGGDGRKKKKYRDLLKKIVPIVSQENTLFLIPCLQCAFEENADDFKPILESYIIQRGADAASIYIRFSRDKPKASTDVLQKAVEILESTVPKSRYIDLGLARIYENNTDFVVERLKKRILNRKTIKLMNYYPLSEIKKIGIEPVLSMVESLIDDGKLTHLHTKKIWLKDLFLPQENWIAWCEKRSDDERKECVIIILSSLRIILTELINYESSEIRDRAVELVKVFAKKKRIDYEKETGEINYKSDHRTGWENKENAIKALQVLEVIQSPKYPIDVETLTNNLKKAPHLSKTIEAEWLIKNASSDNPHILAYIFSQKLHEVEGLLLSQVYWENVFKILDEYKVNIQKNKLNELKNDVNILSEFEVFSRLAPFFEITIEPDIEGLGDLDALIEFEGEKALIEVATVREKLELSLAHGGNTVPGGKFKNILLSKFKGQLKEGKSNPGIPILLISKLENFGHVLGSLEILGGIYGEFQIALSTHKETQEVVEEGYTRNKEHAFYNKEGTNIVTAIGAYRSDLDREDPLVGEFYRPFVTPVNKMSQKFLVRIRNALFGKSETSDWKSLMLIYGVDEQMAKLLYSSGIEDLGVLAGIQEDEFVVDGITWEELSRLRNEARRVIGAISKDSVKFLKGMNRETLDILQRKGIYLIKDILEKRAPPEGISHDAWALITEDAKRVSKSE